jgi:hypothetical protein
MNTGNRVRQYETEEPALFWDRFPEPGWVLYHTLESDWSLDRVIEHAARNIPLEPILVNASKNPSGVYALPAGVAYVDCFPGSVTLWLGAASKDELLRYRKAFDGIPVPPPLPQPKGQVWMNYMLRGRTGDARSFSRLIDAPSWTEIQENYSLDASRELAGLMTGKPERQQGRIGILRGITGSGKTMILRALASEWRLLAHFTYILDLQNFFADPAYMLDALLTSTEDRPGFSRWHVILCEDAEKYINHRAKVGTDQLSTLLNLGDGMLGQGLKILFLFTTNAEVSDIDPAILRPGRCFLNLEIPALAPAEATKWLSRHGSRKTADQAMTLAELYHQGKEEKNAHRK